MPCGPRGPIPSRVPSALDALDALVPKTIVTTLGWWEHIIHGIMGPMMGFNGINIIIINGIIIINIIINITIINGIIIIHIKISQ